ncbi:malate dehydrogenase [Striga asiatica]|uniref:Malate dehydrogenase n=1 Tax=Striga asiatica TaxID=4170 RepID=A0A5A7PQU9_STRAF|nr:malate dehydrogenase [Striga asiatica]
MEYEEEDEGGGDGGPEDELGARIARPPAVDRGSEKKTHLNSEEVDHEPNTGRVALVRFCLCSAGNGSISGREDVDRGTEGQMGHNFLLAPLVEDQERNPHQIRVSGLESLSKNKGKQPLENEGKSPDQGNRVSEGSMDVTRVVGENIESENVQPTDLMSLFS